MASLSHAPALPSRSEPMLLNLANLCSRHILSCILSQRWAGSDWKRSGAFRICRQSSRTNLAGCDIGGGRIAYNRCRSNFGTFCPARDAFPSDVGPGLAGARARFRPHALFQRSNGSHEHAGTFDDRACCDTAVVHLGTLRPSL